MNLTEVLDDMSTIDTQYKALMMHLINADGFTSVLKGIPYSRTNLIGAKWLVRMFNKCERSDVRVRYRGPRPANPNHTLKKHATHFDVYVR